VGGVAATERRIQPATAARLCMARDAGDSPLPGPTRLRPSWHRLFDGIFALHFALGKAPEFLVQFLVKSTLWRLH